MGGGGGGKSAPSYEQKAATPPAPIVTEKPEAKEPEAELSDSNDKARKAAAAKSIYFDEDRLGESAKSAGTVYNLTLGG